MKSPREYLREYFKEAVKRGDKYYFYKSDSQKIPRTKAERLEREADHIYTQLIILVLMLLGTALLTAYIIISLTTYKASDPPKPYAVVNKHEAGGRCYIEAWIEVTPEEYIGLDIGDEYDIK